VQACQFAVGRADSDLMGGVTKEFIISPIGKEDVVIIISSTHLFV
jgi:hypothetical protein